MKLYTKQGDDGSTGLIGNVRVSKTDPRVVAYGEVDETNAAIGLALVASDDQRIIAALTDIQGEMFTLGAELATPSEQDASNVISEVHIERLEQWIDEYSHDVEPLRNFVLPGGHEVAARLHYARTVCRRAERAVVELSQLQTVRSEPLIYLNRISDLLFAMARYVNQSAGVSDTIWKPGESSSA